MAKSTTHHGDIGFTAPETQLVELREESDSRPDDEENWLAAVDADGMPIPAPRPLDVHAELLRAIGECRGMANHLRMTPTPYDPTRDGEARKEQLDPLLVSVSNAVVGLRAVFDFLVVDGTRLLETLPKAPPSPCPPTRAVRKFLQNVDMAKEAFAYRAPYEAGPFRV